MIEDALYSISPAEREVWVRCGMAIKSELGESGFDVWDRWSRQADNYRQQDARAVWRSIKPYGGITIASLYADAKQNGWRGNGEKIEIDYAAIRKRQEAEQARDDLRRKRAAQTAQELLRQATMDVHPYLEKKGFPTRKGLVINDLLLVPMRDNRGALVGMQTIKPWGEKKFIPGSRAKGAMFSIGMPGETFLCEGYATALSIVAALNTLYRKSRVVVTFSAANLATVAGVLHGARYIVADCDESGTGERYARQTGLPFWMPPAGDANDFHLEHGVRALANELNRLRALNR